MLKKKKGQQAENIADVSAEETTSDATTSSTPEHTLAPELTDPNNPKYKYVIKNKKARQQSKERKAVIIIAIILLALFAVGAVIYGFYSAVEINNFSIYVENEGGRILSLSSKPDFASSTQHLEVSGPDHMDNTSIYMSPFGDIPIEDKILAIAEGEGQMSTAEDKYIAFSFYLKNITTDTQYYNEVFKIKEATQGIEKALRVMVIKNYEVEVYGALADDGNPEKVVCTEHAENKYTPLDIETNAEGVREIHHLEDADYWYCTPFHSQDYVFYNKGFELGPEQTVKYSLVVWLEGWDPDCVNDIIGGLMKVEFAFEVAPKPEG
ncbi:MAG: hypothetical protein J6V69_01140 [Clostridia bacterium]|nr:hypothetical protein [Clostridia bacterium]